MSQVIQIRRDGLYHKEDAVYARTELSPQKPVRDSVSKQIFGFEPFQECADEEAQVWIKKTELVAQKPTDHDLAVYVRYAKPTEEGYVGFKGI